LHVPVDCYKLSLNFFCRTTKQLFANIGVNPTVIEVDRLQNGSAIQDVLSEMTGARTVSHSI